MASSSTSDAWSFSSFTTSKEARPLPLLLDIGNEDAATAALSATELRRVLATEPGRELTSEQTAVPLRQRADALIRLLGRGEALCQTDELLTAAIGEVEAAMLAGEVALVVAARDAPADDLVKPAVAIAETVVQSLLAAWAPPPPPPPPPPPLPPLPLAPDSLSMAATDGGGASADAPSAARARSEMHATFYAKLHRLLLTAMALLSTLLPEGRTAAHAANIHVARRHANKPPSAPRYEEEEGERGGEAETPALGERSTLELPRDVLRVCLHVAYSLTATLPCTIRKSRNGQIQGGSESDGAAPTAAALRPAAPAAIALGPTQQLDAAGACAMRVLACCARECEEGGDAILEAWDGLLADQLAKTTTAREQLIAAISRGAIGMPTDADGRPLSAAAISARTKQLAIEIAMLEMMSAEATARDAPAFAARILHRCERHHTRRLALAGPGSPCVHHAARMLAAALEVVWALSHPPALPTARPPLPPPTLADAETARGDTHAGDELTALSARRTGRVGAFRVALSPPQHVAPAGRANRINRDPHTVARVFLLAKAGTALHTGSGRSHEQRVEAAVRHTASTALAGLLWEGLPNSEAAPPAATLPTDGAALPADGAALPTDGAALPTDGAMMGSSLPWAYELPVAMLLHPPLAAQVILAGADFFTSITPDASARTADRKVCAP